MPHQDKIIIKGLTQNNLKNISLEIPKYKIVVFTGVSGSGKSSIVFDTIATECSRQINETYPAFVRGRLPKYEKPKCDLIQNLSASVIVDQSRLGGNARSTVGTISDLYAMMRVLFSRIGEPYVGTASCFSFNDPAGMCPECSGLGKVTEINIASILNENESLSSGMIDLKMYQNGHWSWNQYAQSGLFDIDKKLKDYSEEERNLLLYGAYKKGEEQVNKRVEGIYNHLNRLLLKRDRSDSCDTLQKRIETLIVQRECSVCHGRRLNHAALSCSINGYNISELCDLEFLKLRDVLHSIIDKRGQTIVQSLVASLDRMIDIGLPYLNMNRESASLSGGEAQRLKLVRYMGSSLTDMIYIFDEPSTGMHPRDVHRMTDLLKDLRDKGNSVLVVEHDKDVISIADEVIEVGPLAGKNGGQILFQGSYENLLISDTKTGNAMKRMIPIKSKPRIAKEFLPIKDAMLHNLKNISVDIPLNVLTVVTGVAGSGKSSLIRDIFANQYKELVVLVDQSPITVSGRSTPATYLGFFDEIRKLIATENGVSVSLFSFNSKGACPVCDGKGMVVTELVFMDPVVTVCEACEGKRYSDLALSYRYHGKNIVEIQELLADDALEFFKDNYKIGKVLKAMIEVGLPYLSLGQPLSTLSGGERQRVKLAKNLYKKGNIYVLDEPTTGLHASDVENIMKLLDIIVKRGNTVVVIEHNLDVIKQADYIIDIGPDGGTEGGEVVFTGTPQEMVESANTITSLYLRNALD